MAGSQEKRERNRAIVAMRKKGYRYREVAVEFGVSYQRVQWIVKRAQRRARR